MIRPMTMCYYSEDNVTIHIMQSVPNQKCTIYFVSEKKNHTKSHQFMQPHIVSSVAKKTIHLQTWLDGDGGEAT